MKKNKIIFWGMVALLLTLFACSKEAEAQASGGSGNIGNTRHTIESVSGTWAFQGTHPISGLKLSNLFMLDNGDFEMGGDFVAYRGEYTVRSSTITFKATEMQLNGKWIPEKSEWSVLVTGDNTFIYMNATYTKM
jgi:hypothetical protein